MALTTFSDLVQEAREQVRRDALAAGLPTDAKPLRAGGAALPPMPMRLGCIWHSSGSGLYGSQLYHLLVGLAKSAEKIRNTFGRQALPMTWDFAEANCLTESSGGFIVQIGYVAKAVEALPRAGPGTAIQADASVQTFSRDKLVSTDPPYYDNIGYADLSDYLLLVAPSLSEAGVPGPLRHACRAQSRRVDRHALPPRQQREGGVVLPWTA